MSATRTRRAPAMASMPRWIKPQLAALVKQAPDGAEWLHELKLLVTNRTRKDFLTTLR